MIKTRQQPGVRGGILSRVLCAALGFLACAVWIFRPDDGAARYPILSKTKVASRHTDAGSIARGAMARNGEARLTRLDHRWIPEAERPGSRIRELPEARAAAPRWDAATLAELVSYEAGVNLQMLTDRYGLSPDQQRRAFPIVAMMSPDYQPALPIEGVAANDPYLDALRAARLQSADTRSDASFDAIEGAVAPLLTSEQEALVAQEQLDRYYWWTEVLAGIAADADAQMRAAVEAALASPESNSGATPGTGSPSDGTSDTSTPPEDHQVDNLLDFLNGGG